MLLPHRNFGPCDLNRSTTTPFVRMLGFEHAVRCRTVSRCRLHRTARRSSSPGPVIVAALAIWLSAAPALSQEKTTDRDKSPVFKSSKPPAPLLQIPPSDHLQDIWQTFLISRKASAGDVFAQHELGIRYFLGVGVEADSARALLWMRKAAEQGLTEARFNVGILLYNGWGGVWDPFEAFDDFRACAGRKMVDAQFFLSLFYLDNLVVPMNVDTARALASIAAGQGKEAARELVEKIDEYRRQEREVTEAARRDSSRSSAGANPLQSGSFVIPVVVDLDKADQDTSSSGQPQGMATLLSNALGGGDPQLQQALGFSRMTQETTDSSTLAAVVSAANAGSPEALTFLGRGAERGAGLKRDRILAASYYVRAIRMDSPRAARLLWKMIQQEGFVAELKTRAGDGDPEALFAWAGLVGLGLDGFLVQAGAPITEQQALGFLREASAKPHLPSMIELGLCYHTGRWTERDQGKARDLWKQAERLGSREAAVRIAVIDLAGTAELQDTTGEITLISEAIEEGSVLAEVALAYCYERGRGVEPRFDEALNLYRAAYRRGSQDAYRALRRLHDAIRPAEDRFRIPE